MKTFKPWLCATLLAAAAFASPLAHAQAEAYPTKPITIVVPFAAGGVADATARLLGQKLQESWKQPVVVENKTGGGGSIGATYVSRAQPDGYTVLWGVSALVLQPLLTEKPTYDAFADFAPITLVAKLPVLLSVPQSSPARTLEEFVALSKANPGAQSMGNYGVGTSSHLLGLMLAKQIGVEVPQVPYAGSTPLITALLGGQGVSAAMVDSATARPHASKIRFLAVTGTQRLKGLPDLPNFSERGFKGLEQDGWLAVLVPAKTPKPVADKLTAEFARIIATPEVQAKIESFGISPVGSTPAELAKMMRTDAEVYGKVIKEANLKLN